MKKFRTGLSSLYHKVRLLVKATRVFEDARQNMIRVGVQEGMRVVDLGCGFGFYTFAMSDLVGPEGTVYALDHSPDCINHITMRAKDSGRRNIEAILSKAEDTGLPSDSVDIILIVLVLHDIEDKERAVRECYRVLKPSGLLAINEEGAMPREGVFEAVEGRGFKFDREVGGDFFLFRKVD
ncbi:MAG: class I SAM-dependent methyltransferase [Candidatus Bathyarchaeia archaeon]